MKIPQQLLAPIVGVLAGCFGIGVGLIIRQPEINELHRQVAKLQKKADELKETVRKQNDEISALITRYRALQVWQVIQKHDLRKQIEQAWYNADAAYAKYHSAEAASASAKVAFAYEEQKAEAGRSTIFDFNDAKTRMEKAESEAVQAKYEFVFRSKVLDFYRGKPLQL